VSGGLFTVGLGQPVYLDALVTNGIPASNVLGVTWILTNVPVGSTAALAPSPLGTNVPIYSPADRAVFQLAGRQMFRPDVVGQYTITALVNTNGGNLVLTRGITGSRYMGLQTCALCHSGGAIADDKYTTFTNTAHASFFKRAIDGQESSYYASYCISCHVVGYDTNPLAVNGGFDDVAAQVGWTFPTVLTNGNWAAMTNSLKKPGQHPV